MTVNGTDSPAQEPNDVDPVWYSHKIKNAGLRYEIVVTIKCKKASWLNGHNLCGYNPDLVISHSKLKQMLRPGEMIIADSRYNYERCVTPTGRFDFMSKVLNSLRAPHERLNKCLKQFRMLSH